jgi:hypothetical protein
MRQCADSMGDVVEFEASSTACSEMLEDKRVQPENEYMMSSSFTWFRINYVLVMSAIMLADGLQGGCQKLSIVSLGFTPKMGFAITCSLKI